MTVRLAMLLGAFVLCVVPLALGIETLLVATLPGGLPAGNLLSMLAFLTGALIPAVGMPSCRPLNGLGWAAFAAGLPWLPLGIYLSGNARLSFGADSSGSAVFWAYTGCLSVLVLLLVNVALLMTAWRWWRRRGRDATGA